ncbi:hypothetical protein AVEN_30872-1 [Araneus ventricosus]|uniref:EGF-like domain-containing protein n=1 Tax=Araneus ventricosus TaxID=182803 RepID=A0A4Y2P0I3_ARAVE|nr:hypothetical protein AVEN_30872-1 [Araneus ventricosus]
MDSKTREKKTSVTGGTGCKQPGKKKEKERKSSRLNVFIYSAGDLDPCAGEYCKNFGICTRLGRNAVCLCAEGFAGHQCEENIDECIQKPCFNDGTCIDTGENSFPF